VLLKIYAKCVEGHDEIARCRIAESQTSDDDTGGPVKTV
jgi:hypothetical protein